MRPGQFIQWHDLFFLVDDGTISPTRYEVIERAMQEQAKLFPFGIACFTVLPPGTKPPPDDVKLVVKDVLTRLGPSFSCLTYIIEGTGFKGVTARASLIGMKIFAPRPYPIYVETTVQEGLVKVLPHLAKGMTVTTDVNVIMKAIADAGAKWNASSPASSRASDMTSK
jgi:hypothetical protein